MSFSFAGRQGNLASSFLLLEALFLRCYNEPISYFHGGIQMIKTEDILELATRLERTLDGIDYNDLREADKIELYLALSKATGVGEGILKKQ